MANKKVPKKDKSKRDFGPHSARVKEMTNPDLLKIREGNPAAEKELARRPKKGAAKPKNEAAREAARVDSKERASRQALYSGDARKMK